MARGSSAGRGAPAVAVGLVVAVLGAIAVAVGLVQLLDEGPTEADAPTTTTATAAPADPTTTTGAPTTTTESTTATPVSAPATVTVEAQAPDGFEFVDPGGTAELTLSPDGDGLALTGPSTIETTVRTTDGSCTFVSRSAGTVDAAVDRSNGDITGAVVGRTGDLEATAGGPACQANEVTGDPQPDQELSGRLDLATGLLEATATEGTTAVGLRAEFPADTVAALVGDEGAPTEADSGNAPIPDTSAVTEPPAATGEGETEAADDDDAAAVALTIGGGLGVAAGVGVVAARWPARPRRRR